VFFHEITLVEVDDHGRHIDLPREEHMLLRLRHGADRRGHDEDRAVHLGGARDHVLDVVGVARAVDVSVVPLFGLVFDVRESNREDLGRVAAERLGVRLGQRRHRTSRRRIPSSQGPSSWQRSASSCRGRRVRWCRR